MQTRIERIVPAIEAGTDTPELLARLRDSESRRVGLRTQAAASADDVVDLHPHLPDIYRRKIEALQQALNADPGRCAEVVGILRSLIDRIVIHPEEGRGKVRTELHGRLAAILALANGNVPGTGVGLWW